MHHTTDAAQSSLLGHLVLAPLSAYREACSPTHNEVVEWKEFVALRQNSEVSLSCLH